MKARPTANTFSAPAAAKPLPRAFGGGPPRAGAAVPARSASVDRASSAAHGLAASASAAASAAGVVRGASSAAPPPAAAAAAAAPAPAVTGIPSVVAQLHGIFAAANDAWGADYSLVLSRKLPAKKPATSFKVRAPAAARAIAGVLGRAAAVCAPAAPHSPSFSRLAARRSTTRC
jgi:DNA polymerase-3 subunit gamma/tau